jgi:hypothetical protein
MATTNTSFSSDPGVGYFITGTGPPNRDVYNDWTWAQIEAAICGGSMIVPGAGGETKAQGLADPGSLFTAGNVFEYVRLTLNMVAQSLTAQAEALAGPSDGAPWTGDAANEFYQMMQAYSAQVQANADVLSGLGPGSNPNANSLTVPQELVNDANYLSKAQALVMDIDEWYAAQAKLIAEYYGLSAYDPSGLVHISQFPKLVSNMSNDMRENVLYPLESTFDWTNYTIQSPPPLTAPGTGNGGTGLPTPSPPPPTGAPPPGGLGNVNDPNPNLHDLTIPQPNLTTPPPNLHLPASPFGLPDGTPGSGLGGLPSGDLADVPLSDEDFPPLDDALGAADLGGLGSLGGLDGFDAAELPSALDEPGLAGLESSPLGEDLAADTGAADEAPALESGSAGLDGMPMMPGMGGMGGLGAGLGGAAERSDASGLLGGEDEPWQDEAAGEEPLAGAATGGAGLDGFGPMMPGMGGLGAAAGGGAERSDASGLLGGEQEPWQDVAVAEELLAGAAGRALLATAGSGPEQLTGAQAQVPAGRPAELGDEERREEHAAAAPPALDQAGAADPEADPEDEAAAWGTVAGAAATLLTVPPAGLAEDQEPDDAGLARWRPSAAEPGAARLPETPLRAGAGPPPGPPPEKQAPEDEAADSGEPGEDRERSAADLLVGDAAQWGQWQADPGDL